MAVLLFSLALGGLLFLAFALLALTQFQHRRATGQQDLPAHRIVVVRKIAGVLLVMALAMAVWQQGGGFGFLLWVGLASLAACMVALALSWQPRTLVPLAMLMQARVFWKKQSE
ncbi:DUF3325 domain-containing protein [Acetobacter syzygii]|mgnify:FL=1|uniref:DUF3325 domain-containing protein n=1 Tax=Acetobacter syzygii TaxID=146476 RepID=A0A270BLR4_9PROT|nr:DUF3325 domain-containing protein [Acetobacter syzygii]PAL25982.1 hypothetical protein B9K05_07675 [Acetobacter syzygii]PAL26102.1 hypothetical protein B9K04_07170 [Acetobacter syzygii]GAN70424.1 hypothetical protein Absy_007_007 [Acetobacter syzygii]GBR61729.1 hypothetical protein AA0483_0006 [Acetobacter syzygii NRIC 0483]GEL56968.1 hypothetical protein ASY01nite_20340 [Acetobacter syzygii]